MGFLYSVAKEAIPRSAFEGGGMTLCWSCQRKVRGNHFTRTKMSDGNTYTLHKACTLALVNRRYTAYSSDGHRNNHYLNVVSFQIFPEEKQSPGGKVADKESAFNESLKGDENG